MANIDYRISLFIIFLFASIIITRWRIDNYFVKNKKVANWALGVTPLKDFFRNNLSSDDSHYKRLIWQERIFICVLILTAIIVHIVQSA